MRILILLLLPALLFFALPASATHLVGGELEIKHLNNLSYQISMNMYFDAVNGSPGAEEQSITVAAFEKRTNRLLETFTLNRRSTSFVSYTNPACRIGNLQTKLIRYERVVELSPGRYNDAGGYYLVWERCCRNNVINNIMNPEASGMVYYMEFPPVWQNNALFLNSTPVFNPVPGDYLCVGELYTYSFQATDTDGDSLVYSLATPLRGHTSSAEPQFQYQSAPYSFVIWRQGYEQDHMIVGNPSLNINARTGVISVRPTRQGLHVFAIRCEEFRNGRKIGEVRRDFQMQVLACPTNVKPQLSLKNPQTGFNYRAGDTLVITDRTDNCFRVEFTDTDAGQNLSLRVVPRNFQPAPSLSVTTGSSGRGDVVLSSELCWPDCAIASQDSALYFADLIVSDDACSSSKADTLELRFLVLPKPNARPVLTKIPAGDTAGVRVGETLVFHLEGTDADDDPLTLSMQGSGFDPAAVGMKLEQDNSTSQFRYRFSWSPECGNYNRRKEYPLLFVLKDRSCYAAHTDTVSVRITLRQVDSRADEFLPPNIFTPNNDGLNDYFTMPTLPLDNCDDQFSDITIFNRWGGRVYKSSSRTFAWDGANVTDGVYFYLLKFQHKTYKGHVTIVR